MNTPYLSFEDIQKTLGVDLVNKIYGEIESGTFAAIDWEKTYVDLGMNAEDLFITELSFVDDIRWKKALGI